MKKIIFVVEDDASIRDLYEMALDAAQFDVYCFSDAESMFESLENRHCDLIILDVMLPGMNGLAALRILKGTDATADIPVIVASAKGDEQAKVDGLDFGADDYIAKPFGMKELVARVNANLRKHSGNVLPTVITVAEVAINDKEHEVYVGGEPVQLTLKEYNLLHMLMENADDVVKRETLLYRVWGYDYYGETRTLDMHIKSLRRKLGDTAAGKHIVTVRGVGYKFSSE